MIRTSEGEDTAHSAATRNPEPPASHNAPTAAEISKTTTLSEMKIWIIAKIFAHRASSGASVGPNVELCVNATNR